MSKTSSFQSKATASRASASKGGKLKAGVPPVRGKEKPKRGLEWTLPAFSICQRPTKNIDWDQLQKNVIRRQAPEGEDVKGIRLVLKELKDKTIPVHDFINLISSYTFDNGAELRSNLGDEVNNFRTMCRKIYETMTQDVSDVLINEQLLTLHFYQEKHDLYMEKMMRAINEIYDMAPTFDFESYYKRRGEYLRSILPLPRAATLLDPDSESASKRQQLYHRLQWLRNEGERLLQENNQLEQKLGELREQQEYEQSNAAQIAATAEAKSVELSKEENKMRDTLQKLNIDMEKSIIGNETQTMAALNATNLSPIAKEKIISRKKKKKVSKRPEWISVIAQEIEMESAQEAIASEKESIPFDSSMRKLKLDATLMESTSDVSNVTPRIRQSRVCFDPEFNSTEMPQPSDDVEQKTEIEQSNLTVQKERRRRNMPPADSWGGFY